MKGHYFAGMHIMQRCESMNAFFNKYVKGKMKFVSVHYTYG